MLKILSAAAFEKEGSDDSGTEDPPNSNANDAPCDILNNVGINVNADAFAEKSIKIPSF